MRALALDYLRSGRGPHPVTWLLAISAVIVTIDVGLRYRSFSDQVTQAEMLLAKRPGARAELSLVADARPVGDDEYAFARDTARRLTTPWSALFRALEGARTDRVALLSVEPDLERRTVSISGEAKDYLAALSYVASLGEQPGLRNVHLVRHEVQRNSSQRAVAFTVSVGWKERQ
jgi:hypothetical protein